MPNDRQTHELTPADRKTILITGCSSGIGLHAANTLQDRGYSVFASARNPDDVQRLSESGLTSLHLDLDDPLSIEKALDKVLQLTGGKLYGLFNNGGFGQAGAVEDLPTDALRAQFETLVFGWHDLTRRVIPIMRRQGEGRIVQNSSVLGFAAMPYRGAYNAAKFAIEGLSDTLRLELRGSNIHVSIIQPGPIRTKFRRNGIAKFRENIDSTDSIYTERYAAIIERLSAKTDSSKFTLGPEAVTTKLIHAIESEKPKSRYRVTTPTRAFAIAKRLLPSAALDRILGSVS